MKAAAYESLFKKLGFDQFGRGRRLRHPARPATVYFNVKRNGEVYFTAYRRDRAAFSEDLWANIAPQQSKDSRPNLITLLPRAGREDEAIRALLVRIDPGRGRTNDSRMFTWRNSPAHARSVFDAIFAGLDRSLRQQFERFLYESIAFAANAFPDRWGITLYRRGIRFNVGQVENVVYFRGEGRVLLDPMSAPKNARFQGRKYASAGGARLAHLPYSTSTDDLNALRASHNAAISLSARGQPTISIRRAHSPGVLRYLEQVTGNLLPTPTYFARDRDEAMTAAVLALPVQQIKGIPTGITRVDVLNAIVDIDAGRAPSRFGASRLWDVLHEGKLYPPKRLIGLAARRIANHVLMPSDFSGGGESKCHSILTELQFDIVPKQGLDESKLVAEDGVVAAIRLRTDIPSTTRDQLIKARNGQGRFRIGVTLVEKHGCRVTRIADIRHLRASHIKPWKDSDDREKLDGFNGLMLAPHIDHLFDKGYISFEDNGELIASSKSIQAVLLAWGIKLPMNVGIFRPEQHVYLKYHRKNILIGTPSKA